MEQTNKQHITEKKQWETPKAEVISNDQVKSGSHPNFHEAFATTHSVTFYAS